MYKMMPTIIIAMNIIKTRAFMQQLAFFYFLDADFKLSTPASTC